MNILSKLLKKRGIKDVTELDKEEKQQFEQWQKVLNKEEITIKDITEFCDGAIGTIEVQFGDVDISNEKMSKLALQHAIYKKIRGVINAPQTERESLIEYLTNLLK
jgi:hypothetical protein